MPPPSHDGSWASVNWAEVWASVGTSGIIGLVRCLYLVRRGRRFKWLDVALEPCLAVLAGMLIWALTEYTNTPDIFQGALTSLGAWGGPKTIHWLELKYMGGTRSADTPTRPAEL
jgi:LydA holin phage, holin superfamily III